MTLSKWDWATLYLAWTGSSAGGAAMMREAGLKDGLTRVFGMLLGLSLLGSALVVAAMMTYAVLRKEAK